MKYLKDSDVMSVTDTVIDDNMGDITETLQDINHNLRNLVTATREVAGFLEKIWACKK